MRRLVLVLTVLAGVLAMHGFTVDHAVHLPAPSMSTDHAEHSMPVDPTSHSGGPKLRERSAVPVAMASMPSSRATGYVDVASTPAGYVAGAPAGFPSVSQPDSSGHDMGGVCLAILAGLALLIIGMLASFGRRLFGVLPRIAPPVLRGLAPPPRAPSLSFLCVLRT